MRIAALVPAACQRTKPLYLHGRDVVRWMRLCPESDGRPARGSGEVARCPSGYNRGLAWDLRHRHVRPNSRLAPIARTYGPHLGAFQQRLQQAGKAKMVIRIALARKLLVILNAKARDARVDFTNAT